MSSEPPSLAIDDIYETFALLDDWEERYRYIIELGRALPPFPEEARNDANRVPGCASQVWFTSRIENKGKPLFFFLGDSDAHIVRGLIAILHAACSGRAAEEVARFDPDTIFTELGLKEHLTPQRSNGFHAMVERLRHDAAEGLHHNTV